ncbi:MAG: hypothetical protein ACUVQR_14100 [Thermogutta sp.]
MNRRQLLIIPVLFSILRFGMACGELPPIETVSSNSEGVIIVNGRPFLPIMAWLQPPENLSVLKKCGMNTTAGYWPGAGGTKDVIEYLKRVQDAGLYGVMPYHPGLHGHPHLLAYIHDDEPDLPRQVSSANIVPAKELRLNSRTPLWKMVDGDETSWSVLDPLQDAQWALILDQPATVQRIAIWVTVSPGLSLPEEVILTVDDKQVGQFSLQAKRGKQEFDLGSPVTGRAWQFRVTQTKPGNQVWGSIGEIAGYAPDGRNVFLSPPRWVPRSTPEQTWEQYQKIKAADPSRPVAMTFTGYFHPHFGKWREEERKSLYPMYIRATDIVGFDIYPIYGWNKPEWIHLVYEATAQLKELAGPRPVYAWIETSKGGQYTGDLERQKDVTPEHIRAEVWMALCGGATAIGYFTHIWKPSYRQFGVPEENQAALRALNDQLTRLAPAILAKRNTKEIQFDVPSGVRVAAFSTEYDNSIYLFAVNYDPALKTAEVTFQVPLAKIDGATNVEVVDEDRGVALNQATFTDSFAPLAVHIYRISKR